MISHSTHTATKFNAIAYYIIEYSMYLVFVFSDNTYHFGRSEAVTTQARGGQSVSQL